MKKLSDVFGSHIVRVLSTAGLFAVAASIVFGTANAAPSRAQSPVERPTPTPPVYQFEVATIKPSPRTDSGGVAGFLTDDSFQAKNYSLRAVMLWTYGMWAGRDATVLGGPKWLDTERYYIDAKMDAAVADKLKKLSPDQRELAQRQMVQALLADRLKLAIHRETKELPIYTLTIAKNGPKLKESKPGDTYEKAFLYADKFADSVRPGAIFLVVGGGPAGNTMTIYGFGVSIAAIVRQLNFWSGRTVLDRTGLAGNYDITVQFARGNQVQASSEGAPGGQSVPSATDPAGGPDLFGAIQQQLGLKLESGKGPVEIIVIDHVERPSGN